MRKADHAKLGGRDRHGCIVEKMAAIVLEFLRPIFLSAIQMLGSLPPIFQSVGTALPLARPAGRGRAAHVAQPVAVDIPPLGDDVVRRRGLEGLDV